VRDTAVELLEAAYKATPKSDRLRTNLATLLAMFARQLGTNKQHQKCVAAFRRSIDLEADEDVKHSLCVYLHNHGVERANAEDFDGGIASLTQALAIEPAKVTREQLASVCFARAVKKVISGNATGARADVREGRKHDPDSESGRMLEQKLS
jgi:tetratricopeptide (TPR) repeat protein